MKRICGVLLSLSLTVLIVLSINTTAFASDIINVTDIKPSTTQYSSPTLYNGTTIKNDTTSEVWYFVMEIPLLANYLSLSDTNLGSYTSLQPNESFVLTCDVVCTVNKFYKTPKPDPDPTPASAPAHTHDFVEGEIYSATQTTDGLGGIYCKSCGEIKESWPISAYGYSINDYATPMVNASKAGQNITFELGEWNSFPKAFMEKIAAKSAEGVTFVFHYKWNHVKQEITIPAGTQVDLNYDWYGPAKMAELYGAN